MKTKLCKKCNIEKSIEEFHKNKRMKDGLHGHCKSCKKKYDLSYRNTEKVQDYQGSEDYKSKKLLYKNENYIKTKLATSKCNAKRRDIEFTITENDVECPKYCPLLGIEIDYSFGKGMQWNAASIDRIDNSKGYIPGNVWILSRLANTMKSCANKEEIIKFSKNALKIFDK